MITDARTIENEAELEADICIVGAGIAGIALAREFIGHDARVCLLESGGLEHEESLEDLSRGENVGLPYKRLDGGRYRGFGGGARTWAIDIGHGRGGARLRPLDPVDFEKRDCIPYSGWPFDYEHLRPYYERAQDLFGIGRMAYDVEHWADELSRPRLPFNTDRVQTTMFQFGAGEQFHRDYREDVHRAENVNVVLYSNAVELETDPSGSRVDRVRAACLPGSGAILLPSGTGFQRVRVTDLPGSRFWVKARQFVLAAGGTENPRLLLLSRKVHDRGLGNQHDLVGRFFMEHPHLWSGRSRPASRRLFDLTQLYRIHQSNGVPVMAKLTLAETVIREEGLPNYCVSIHATNSLTDSKSVRSLLRLRSAVLERKPPEHLAEDLRNVVLGVGDIGQVAYHRLAKRAQASTKPFAFRLNHMSEQVPNPDSRVTLSDQRDSLGIPRVRLDWRLQPIDVRAIRRAQEIIGEELHRAGLGKLELDMHDDSVPPSIHGGWHHMGTTRMHVSEQQGVVDPNCRVHGVGNLYVSGSSVFPTVGYANPTLTIGALAVRLADHIKRRIDNR